MKSYMSLPEELWMKSPSNNWLRHHGYAMIKTTPKRKSKKRHLKELAEVPFK